MQSLNVVKYLLPTYLACPLLYGDYTGLTDKEIKQLENWVVMNPGYCVSVENDVSFCHDHEFNNIPLAGDCCTFIFHEVN